VVVASMVVGWRTVRGARNLVEILFSIVVKDRVTSLHVLHKKIKGVKLNRTTIVTSKLAD
jgi:hypothetical protein